MNIYPIPAKDILTVDISDNKGILTVYDITGCLVFQYSISSENKININVSNLKRGVYFLSIQNENEIVSEKFIVE